MIEIIQNNPFRILGVYADASAAEIKRNETKIRRFLEVGKSVSFPTDELGNLSAPIRSTESVDRALADISLPLSKIMYACFWYNNGTVREVINKSVDFYAHNQITDAINAFVQLLSSRVVFDEFIHSIVDTCSFSADEVKETYVNVLMDQLSPEEQKCLLRSRLATDSLRESINARQIEAPAGRIQSLIDTCKKVEKVDTVAMVDAAQKLWSNSQPDLKAIAELIGQENPQYCVIRDSVVKQVLQSCINAVNTAQDNVLEKGGTTYRYVTKTAQQLTQEISVVPVSSFLSQRIESNLSIIKNLAEHTKDRIENEMISNEHYCWYCGKMKAENRFAYHLMMYKETNRSYFPTRRVWFKKLPVHINRCENCKNIHENLSDGAGKVFWICLSPNVILLICMLATDNSWAWTLVGILFSIITALAINSIRSDKRCQNMGIKEEGDYGGHPLINYLYKDGWQLSEPTA